MNAIVMIWIQKPGTYGRKYVLSAGYAWVFPVNRNRIRIGVGVGRPDTIEDPIKKLNQIIENRLKPLDRIKNIQTLEFHYGLIPNQGLVKSFVDDGIMLVGDSAGFSNPLLLEAYVMRLGLEDWQEKLPLLQYPSMGQGNIS